LFDSYQSFAKNHHAPFQAQMQRSTFTHRERKHHPKEQVTVQVRATADPTQILIPDVDMTDEEIVLIAIDVWGLNPSVMGSLPVQSEECFVSDEDLSNFLTGMDWNM
jgi:hypothetical protein